jgi:translocation and assembly module TamA
MDVRIKPSNDELKANIEGYIGSLGDRDEQALLRFSRGAEAGAQSRAGLGLLPAADRQRREGRQEPRLVLNIDPGEPVRLRNVTIRVDGPAASLKSFRVPSSDTLKSGAVLNHGRYEDAKRLIQNQASRFGFSAGVSPARNSWSTRVPAWPTLN